MLLVVRQRQKLIHHLAARIAPPGKTRRAQRRVVIFIERNSRVLAIHLACRRDNDLPAKPICQIENRLRSVNVGLDRANGIVHDQLHPHCGGEVVNDIATVHQRNQGIRVPHRIVNETETLVIDDRRQILQRTRRQVINHGNAVAPGQQGLAQVRSDKPRTTGDQYVHHAVMSLLSLSGSPWSPVHASARSSCWSAVTTLFNANLQQLQPIRTMRGTDCDLEHLPFGFGVCLVILRIPKVRLWISGFRVRRGNYGIHLVSKEPTGRVNHSGIFRHIRPATANFRLLGVRLGSSVALLSDIW